ncbi:MAG: hypothetical protein M3Z32_11155 [Acidobacteriota bacterium]|nr:hypothetical protein [Acidobacteriota bacterium]
MSAHTAEKALLIQTLQYLAHEGLVNQWLSKAVDKWKPKREDEGRGLRESLQLMLGEIRRARQEGRLTQLVLDEMRMDLQVKGSHCKEKGLGVEQPVHVNTKKEGVEEVKGLEVWYLEKFLARDPAANPHRFRRFSSPIDDSIVPGIYIFWTKNPTNGLAGSKHELGVGNAPALTRRVATPTTVIELLAP